MDCKKAAALRNKRSRRLANFIKILSILAVMAPFSQTANATVASIDFGGTVPNTGINPGNGTDGCVIQLVQNSTIAISGNFLTLSSRETGGIPGQVDVVKTGPSNLSITVDAPGSFTTNPLGGDTGVTIETTYQASGDTVTPEVDGSVPTVVNNGTTRLNVHLTATRPDAFPSGTYATSATVRCE